jgi:hypothetical protein
MGVSAGHLVLDKSYPVCGGARLVAWEARVEDPRSICIGAQILTRTQVQPYIWARLESRRGGYPVEKKTHQKYIDFGLF